MIHCKNCASCVEACGLKEGHLGIHVDDLNLDEIVGYANLEQYSEIDFKQLVDKVNSYYVHKPITINHLLDYFGLEPGSLVSVRGNLATTYYWFNDEYLYKVYEPNTRRINYD